MSKFKAQLVSNQLSFFIAEDGIVVFSEKTKQTVLIPSFFKQLFEILMKSYPQLMTFDSEDVSVFEGQNSEQVLVSIDELMVNGIIIREAC